MHCTSVQSCNKFLRCNPGAVLLGEQALRLTNSPQDPLLCELAWGGSLTRPPTACSSSSNAMTLASLVELPAICTASVVGPARPRARRRGGDARPARASDPLGRAAVPRVHVPVPVSTQEQSVLVKN